MPRFVNSAAVFIGILLVLGVTAAFAKLVVTLWILLLNNFGGGGLLFGTFTLVPVWFWIAVRFFFPVMKQLRSIDFAPVRLATQAVTVGQVITIVCKHLGTLLSDIVAVFLWIKGQLNA